MTSSVQNRLEIATAERDLLVAKLTGLLGELGVIEPDRSLRVDEIVRLIDRSRDWFRGRRSISGAQTQARLRNTC
jgi:hypothetical protein